MCILFRISIKGTGGGEDSRKGELEYSVTEDERKTRIGRLSEEGDCDVFLCAVNIFFIIIG